MMPILEFIKCFANRQKLGLKASNSLEFLISAFHESFSKSGQNRSQKAFYEFFNSEKIRKNFILLAFNKALPF